MGLFTALFVVGTLVWFVLQALVGARIRRRPEAPQSARRLNLIALLEGVVSAGLGLVVPILGIAGMVAEVPNLPAAARNELVRDRLIAGVAWGGPVGILAVLVGLLAILGYSVRKRQALGGRNPGETDEAKSAGGPGDRGPPQGPPAA